jgi:hypothetical protein
MAWFVRMFCPGRASNVLYYRKLLLTPSYLRKTTPTRIHRWHLLLAQQLLLPTTAARSKQTREQVILLLTIWKTSTQISHHQNGNCLRAANTTNSPSLLLSHPQRTRRNRKRPSPRVRQPLLQNQRSLRPNQNQRRTLHNRNPSLIRRLLLIPQQLLKALGGLFARGMV